jgi:hypothetical protein
MPLDPLSSPHHLVTFRFRRPFLARFLLLILAAISSLLVPTIQVRRLNLYNVVVGRFIH